MPDRFEHFVFVLNGIGDQFGRRREVDAVEAGPLHRRRRDLDAEGQSTNGKAIITAAVAAYEVFCNFTDILEREQGWDQVLHGVVAGAAASAKLMGLDEARIGQAIARGYAEAGAMRIPESHLLTRYLVRDLLGLATLPFANRSKNGLIYVHQKRATEALATASRSKDSKIAVSGLPSAASISAAACS